MLQYSRSDDVFDEILSFKHRLIATQTEMRPRMLDEVVDQWHNELDKLIEFLCCN